MYAFIRYQPVHFIDETLFPLEVLISKASDEGRLLTFHSFSGCKEFFCVKLFFSFTEELLLKYSTVVLHEIKIPPVTLQTACTVVPLEGENTI